ncbi:MAG: family 10 glycosylhydrolase, partial [Phycisphaerae bacterium]|nr:family 10 glycosylhydrolase [Phycisphaerae bacterium]
MRPNGIRLGCCASLGSSYGFGGFRTYCDTIAEHPAGWTGDELGEMVRRVKDCGFEEVVPWTDYPPGEILPADPESAPLAAEDAKASFLKRVKSFVNLAHAEGVRVQLYFAIGTGLMAARKTHEDGTQRLHVNELGATYPQCATRDRQGSSSLDLVRGGEEELAFASLGFPEVRRWIAEWVVGMVAATGADGLQLEPVSTRLDESGAGPHGYDEPIISSFNRRYGRDPRSLPNDDREWVDHRCEFTTQMLREVRRRVDDLGRPVELSVQCHNLKTDS